MDADQDSSWKLDQSGEDWLCLAGALIVVGKSPDGDSIRFIPENPALLTGLAGADAIDPSADGSVQLRLDGIDTPETHYNALAQPLGEVARDELLAWCGFSEVRWNADQVVSSQPDSIPATVLTRMADVNGRPIALLLVGSGLPADGASVAVDDALVARTANFALASSGAAYPTVYGTTPEPVRLALLAPAREAYDAGRGVWAVDASGGFELRSQASIGPAGALILPKLFRRCTDYLKAGMSGETLIEWLRRRQTGRNAQDDPVVVGGKTIRLSDVLRQDGRRVSLTVSPLDMVFLD
jgi:endonuclease YncB( thermonuclease family)